jgi:hypothetical protein
MYLLNWADKAPLLMKSLTARERQIFDEAERGIPIGESDRPVACSLVRRRLLLEDSSGAFSVNADWVPDPIWVPNAVVTGADREVPPLERLRQTQDVLALRLFVELYLAQDLKEDGGIGRQYLERAYDREKVASCAEYVVWGFKRRADFTTSNPITGLEFSRVDEVSDYLERMKVLEDLRLIELAPHLVEGLSADAELLHPYGTGDSTSIEDRLGRAARSAAFAMISGVQAKQAKQNQLLLAPVLRHFGNVQLVGIARLRYRPHTRRTQGWRAELDGNGAKWRAGYEDLEARFAGGRAAS